MLKRIFIFPFYFMVFFTALFALAACDDLSQSDQDTKTESHSNPGSGTSASESNESVPQQEAPTYPKEATSASASEQAAPKQATPKRTIDLTLPDDWDAGNETIVEIPDDNLLPNLFTDKKKSKKASLNGKVLNDEDNKDYVDSIEGAEISVEIEL